LEVNEENLANGKAMFTIYCISCHGAAGVGDGELVKRDKFLGVPNYKDRPITEGSIYHVIMYGRNLMGSHASQLTEKERWQVVMYVQQLRNELLK
jgi:mono/diheme cytochrome c family protein